MAWSGLDNASGIRYYTVRYRLGEVGVWQPWLTGTLKTEASFIGTPDAQYYFAVTATDNVNNTPPILDFGLPILDWGRAIDNPKSKIQNRPTAAAELQCGKGRKYTTCTATTWAARL